MAKFQKLCLTYTRGRKNRFDYSSRFGKFVGKLGTYMANYFECPKEKIQMILPHKDNSSFRESNLLSEIDIGDCWHLGIGITLYDQSSEFPNDTVFLSIIIKESGDSHYTIKLGNYEEEFEVHENNPEEFRVFYKYVYDALMDYYSL